MCMRTLVFIYAYVCVYMAMCTVPPCDEYNCVFGCRERGLAEVCRSIYMNACAKHVYMHIHITHTPNRQNHITNVQEINIVIYVVHRIWSMYLRKREMYPLLLLNRFDALLLYPGFVVMCVYVYVSLFFLTMLCSR